MSDAVGDGAAPTAPPAPADGGLPARLLPGGAMAHAAVFLALAGGLILLCSALLSTASVLLRWLNGQPIPGDFELVSIGSGIAVFGFLAFGTLARSNIMVDSLTSWLPARACQAIDGFWSLVWALVLLVLAERMAEGAWETARSGTTTMVLGLSTWWAVGIGAACLLAAALVAFGWAHRLMRGEG